MLVYETDDSDFADSVIEAMTRAGVDCYRTGGVLPGGSSFTVSIYIRNDSDQRRANDILIQQGAAADGSIKLSPRLIILGIIICVLLALLIVVLQK